MAGLAQIAPGFTSPELLRSILGGLAVCKSVAMVDAWAAEAAPLIARLAAVERAHCDQEFKAARRELKGKR